MAVIEMTEIVWENSEIIIAKLYGRPETIEVKTISLR